MAQWRRGATRAGKEIGTESGGEAEFAGDTISVHQSRCGRLMLAWRRRTASPLDALVILIIQVHRDRGKELADHRRFTLAINIEVYVCDPQSRDSAGRKLPLRKVR